MARITVEDCQQQVGNRFLIVQMAIKRIQQYREGYEPLVESKNKEVVTSLREIAAGKILMTEDMSHTTPGTRFDGTQGQVFPEDEAKTGEAS